MSISQEEKNVILAWGVFIVNLSNESPFAAEQIQDAVRNEIRPPYIFIWLQYERLQLISNPRTKEVVNRLWDQARKQFGVKLTLVFNPNN